MKLEVGMYVRTNLGQIGKLKEINPYYLKIEIKKSLFYTFEVEDAVKASYNIIDLIEAGDYVNGLKVDAIQNGQLLNRNSYDGWFTNIASHSEDIKSIVTKEQMERIEYKVGD